MTALRLSVRRPWRVWSAGRWNGLPALVGAGLVIGVIEATRGREPMDVALAAVFCSVFAALAWIDLERRVIPNRAVYPATALAFAVSEAWSDRGLVAALTGGLAAFVTLAVIRRVSRGGLGGGDVKMAALAGAVLGYPSVLSAALVTTVVGGLTVVTLVAAGRATWRSRVPFAPFLAIGTVVELIY